MIRMYIIIILLLLVCVTSAVWLNSHQKYYLIPGDTSTRYFQDISFAITDHIGIKTVVVLGHIRIQIVIYDKHVILAITNLGTAAGGFFGDPQRYKSSFCFKHGAGPGNRQYYEMQAPCWALIVLFSMYPLFMLYTRSILKWRRRRKGLCIHCSYNLTGNTSGTCPECGKAIG